MKFLGRIFNINNLILLAAISILPFGIRQCNEIYEGFNELKHHTGIVQDKSIATEPFNEKETITITRIKLVDNDTVFSVSKYVEKVNHLVEIGETVQVYTKDITSKFGNSISDEKGRMWFTHNPNEVFHLSSNKYPNIIDFNKNHNSLKKTIWLFPLFSLLFFGWYFYRRSGKKSILVSEYGGFTYN